MPTDVHFYNSSSREYSERIHTVSTKTRVSVYVVQAPMNLFTESSEKRELLLLRVDFEAHLTSRVLPGPANGRTANITDSTAVRPESTL
jgi:hypothetical protein